MRISVCLGGFWICLDSNWYHDITVTLFNLYHFLDKFSRLQTDCTQKIRKIFQFVISWNFLLCMLTSIIQCLDGHFYIQSIKFSENLHCRQKIFLCMEKGDNMVKIMPLGVGIHLVSHFVWAIFTGAAPFWKKQGNKETNGVCGCWRIKPKHFVTSAFP